jgi:hypothetical protein
MELTIAPCHPFPDGAEPKQLYRTLYTYEVAEHRFLDCLHYSACLQATADRHWESFSCKACPIWDSSRSTASQEEPPKVLRNVPVFWRHRGGVRKAWFSGWLADQNEGMVLITNSPHKRLGAWYAKDEIEYKVKEDNNAL